MDTVFILLREYDGRDIIEDVFDSTNAVNAYLTREYGINADDNYRVPLDNGDEMIFRVDEYPIKKEKE